MYITFSLCSVYPLETTDNIQVDGFGLHSFDILICYDSQDTLRGGTSDFTSYENYASGAKVQCVVAGDFQRSLGAFMRYDVGVNNLWNLVVESLR